jgi:hypothetical protein
MEQNKIFKKRVGCWGAHAPLLLLAIFASIYASNARAAEDNITIYNTDSYDPIYARIYYYKGTSEAVKSRDPQGATLDIVTLPYNKPISVVRPPIWRYQSLPYPKHYDRQLVFSDDPNLLKPELSQNEYQKLPSVNIGSTKGGTFYIANRAGHLEGYNAASWVTVKPLIDAKEKASRLVRAQKRKIVAGKKEFQHADDEALVRTAINGALNKEEADYMSKRKMGAIRKSLEQMGIKMGNHAAPTIALVGSGGGYRAMLGAIGSLAQAQEAKLFQASSYVVGLSGSTWAIGGYMSHELWPAGFKEKLIPIIENGLTSINAHEASLIGETLLLKYAFDQKLTIVDIYGALLATRLLGSFQNKRHVVYLSDQAKTLTGGKFAYQLPFPLYSAVRRGQGVATSWWEFTPYEVGSAAYGKFVPSWAYGRHFQGGRSGKDFAPEQSFGFNMGTFGSAFAAEFRIMYNEIIKGVEEPGKTVIKEVMRVIDTQLTNNYLTRVGNKRISSSWAQVHNFMLGMPGSEDLYNAKEIKLVDGGIDFNLPYPLVSGFNSKRKADIVILLDYSGDIKNPAALKGCEDYAKEHKLPFPKITYDNLTSSAISVFKDTKNSAAPIIVYMPLVRDQVRWQSYRSKLKFPEIDYFVSKQLDSFDPIECEQEGFCKTQSFKYAADQSQRLIAQTEFNMMASMPEIKRVIQEWVNAH